MDMSDATRAAFEALSSAFAKKRQTGAFVSPEGFRDVALAAVRVLGVSHAEFLRYAGAITALKAEAESKWDDLHFGPEVEGDLFEDAVFTEGPAVLTDEQLVSLLVSISTLGLLKQFVYEENAEGGLGEFWTTAMEEVGEPDYPGLVERVMEQNRDLLDAFGK